MANLFQSLLRLHRFFLNHLLYPLVLSSALAVTLYAGRVYQSRNLTFVFLAWNLFLAWVPYVCSLWVSSLHQRFPRQWWYLVIPGLLWLIFLPNAPYLVTDLLHLDERPPVPLWYDIGLLLTFGWTGCFLAVTSLSVMQRVTRKFLGRWIAWLFTFGAIGLSGWGIYIGRFLNLNSWDLLLRPQIVLPDLLPRLVHPIGNPQMVGVTGMFAAFLLVCYLTFVSIEYRQPEQVSK